MTDAINPPGVWSPFGAFSMAVIQGDGQIVHLKGQVALDQQGQVVGAQDMRAQVRKVLENIKSVLASMGGEMGDVISLVHYATDIERFMGTWVRATSARISLPLPIRSQQRSKLRGCITPTC